MRRNSYALAALAAAAVPGLRPARTVPIATPIDEFDVAGVVGDDGRRVLVTTPATPAAGLQLEKDVHVADALAGTPVGPLVPTPLGFVRLPEGGRAVVTETPQGSPLFLDRLAEEPEIARSLGRVLARIHAVPAYAAESAGVETFTAPSIRAAHRSQIARARAAEDLPPSVAQRWDALLADDELWAFRPCFVHGGMSEENLFVEGHEITGVTGWHEARTGDPATDLAWLVSVLNPETFDTLYAAYVAELPVAPHGRLVERAQAVGELAIVDWLLHGLDAEDRTIVDDARGMLEDLDHDIAAAAREEAEREYEALNAQRTIIDPTASTGSVEAPPAHPVATDAARPTSRADTAELAGSAVGSAHPSSGDTGVTSRGHDAHVGTEADDASFRDAADATAAQRRWVAEPRGDGTAPTAPHAAPDAAVSSDAGELWAEDKAEYVSQYATEPLDFEVPADPARFPDVDQAQRPAADADPESVLAAGPDADAAPAGRFSRHWTGDGSHAVGLGEAETIDRERDEREQPRP
ncbi:phosphotransferase [Brachybacterium nesterenkovii]|uniref:Macrolide 2'-phosphotransferase n=1 Tax=Brachybacterium nesterenkovii TaxID=47847 RepID=A0A1X6X737_9MICO|nr:phosphotransferase [Brachybacterium nesterenkovii]SLM95071.1 Macrolide 2'-phosphotransferase [Brachybacterium nesterenkovii]